MTMLDQTNIAHQQDLLATYRRNLALFLRQQAEQGGQAYVIPAVANSIHEARQNIQRIKAILRANNVAVLDQPDDAEYAPSTLSLVRRPLRIVLCHVSADTLVVSHLSQRLRAEGLNVLLDEHMLLFEHYQHGETQNIMLAADVLILCLSQASSTKVRFICQEIKDVLDEMDRKNAEAILVVLLRLEFLDIPDWPSNWQSVDLFEADSYGQLMRILWTHPRMFDGKIPVTPNESQQPNIDTENSTIGATGDFRTEPRRLDAAMPSKVVVGRPTELWVQICLPSSEGFRATLPQYTQSGEEIATGDVRTGTLSLAFPLDKKTGHPLAVRIRVEPRAPDFTFDQPYQDIMLAFSSDSGLIMFGLLPNQVREWSIVHVTLKQLLPDDTSVTLGSVSLSLRIAPTGIRLLGHIAWSLVSLTLTSLVIRNVQQEAMVSSPNELEKHPEPVRAIDQAEQENVAEYLVCDEPLLYSLIPPYVKETRNNMYNTRGQIADGRRIFEQFRPELYRKLCEEWGACSKLDDGVFTDEVDLVVRIADIIAPVVVDIPPYLIAAIIIKIGVRLFCGCQEA